MRPDGADQPTGGGGGISATAGTERTNPIESRSSPQWDPIRPFGAGPAPVNRAIMALK